MDLIRRTLLGLLIALAPLEAFAQNVGVSHTAPKCFPDRCRSVKIIADVVASDRVDQVLVYFNAEGSSEDYWVAMRPMDDAPGTYWGYLPVALDDVDHVNYSIEAIDASGRRASTDSFKVEVRNDCEAPELSDEEKRIARNLVVGMTKDGQPAQPPGFRCGGIAALVTPAGDMMANEDCRRKLAKDGDDLLCPFLWKKETALVVGAATTGVLLIDPDDPRSGEVPLSTARP